MHPPGGQQNYRIEIALKRFSTVKKIKIKNPVYSKVQN